MVCCSYPRSMVCCWCPRRPGMLLVPKVDGRAAGAHDAQGRRSAFAQVGRFAAHKIDTVWRQEHRRTDKVGSWHRLCIASGQASSTSFKLACNSRTIMETKVTDNQARSCLEVAGELAFVAVLTTAVRLRWCTSVFVSMISAMTAGSALHARSCPQEDCLRS